MGAVRRIVTEAIGDACEVGSNGFGGSVIVLLDEGRPRTFVQLRMSGGAVEGTIEETEFATFGI